MAATVATVATVVGVGVSIASAAGAFGGPNIPKPPQPASAYSYNSDGSYTEQVWDAGKNAYITKTVLSPDQQAEQTKSRQLHAQILDSLNKTPEERAAQYQQYQDAFKGELQRGVDLEYGKTVRAADESMNARGMTGSKADVDLQTQLAREKMAADTSVQNQAIMAKENLVNADRNFSLQELQALESGASVDSVIAARNAQNTQNAAQLGSGSLMASYAAGVNADMQNWQNEQAQIKGLSSNLINTGSGLAYLYGYNKGASPVAPKVSSGNTAPVGGGYYMNLPY